ESRAARGRLYRLVRPRARSFLAHGILNAFQRLSSSAGDTSSTCVATHQTLPHGSLTPPYRSPEGKVMIGHTETPPAWRHPTRCCLLEKFMGDLPTPWPSTAFSHSATCGKMTSAIASVVTRCVI